MCAALVSLISRFLVILNEENGEICTKCLDETISAIFLVEFICMYVCVYIQAGPEKNGLTYFSWIVSAMNGISG